MYATTKPRTAKAANAPTTPRRRDQRGAGLGAAEEGVEGAEALTVDGLADCAANS
ncbi:hypothetical protein ACFC1I_03885 [Microbacterium sp. NPDC056044]|uniref:hypothetical protein n=1 Tax=Microbacterium sp. NPDC056044 TaxID=3345690 RepID=UPI0035DF4B18